jgi:hypothetical protein
VSLSIARADQEMAAARDIHDRLVQLARDALAGGMPPQVVLMNVYRSALGGKPGQLASAYACAVLRDAERAP